MDFTAGAMFQQQIDLPTPPPSSTLSPPAAQHHLSPEFPPPPSLTPISPTPTSRGPIFSDASLASPTPARTSSTSATSTPSPSPKPTSATTTTSSGGGISLEHTTLPSASPFPSPSSSFLPPPTPGAHEFAVKPPPGRLGRKGSAVAAAAAAAAAAATSTTNSGANSTGSTGSTGAPNGAAATGAGGIGLGALASASAAFLLGLGISSPLANSVSSGNAPFEDSNMNADPVVNGFGRAVNGDVEGEVDEPVSGSSSARSITTLSPPPPTTPPPSTIADHGMATAGTNATMDTTSAALNVTPETTTAAVTPFVLPPDCDDYVSPSPATPTPGGFARFRAGSNGPVKGEQRSAKDGGDVNTCGAGVSSGSDRPSDCGVGDRGPGDRGLGDAVDLGRGDGDSQGRRSAEDNKSGSDGMEAGFASSLTTTSTSTSTLGTPTAATFASTVNLNTGSGSTMMVVSAAAPSKIGPSNVGTANAGSSAEPPFTPTSSSSSPRPPSFYLPSDFSITSSRPAPPSPALSATTLSFVVGSGSGSPSSYSPNTAGGTAPSSYSPGHAVASHSRRNSRRVSAALSISSTRSGGASRPPSGVFSSPLAFMSSTPTGGASGNSALSNITASSGVGTAPAVAPGAQTLSRANSTSGGVNPKRMSQLSSFVLPSPLGSPTQFVGGVFERYQAAGGGLGYGGGGAAPVTPVTPTIASARGEGVGKGRGDGLAGGRDSEGQGVQGGVGMVGVFGEAPPDSAGSVATVTPLSAPSPSGGKAWAFGPGEEVEVEGDSDLEEEGLGGGAGESSNRGHSQRASVGGRSLSGQSLTGHSQRASVSGSVRSLGGQSTGGHSNRGSVSGHSQRGSIGGPFSIKKVSRTIYIKIRDFAFGEGDERRVGLGSDVPKPNRVRRMNRGLRVGWISARGQSRLSQSSLDSWASSSSIGGGDDDDDEEEEDEDGWGGGGWDSFRTGFGRLSWNAGGFGVGASTDASTANNATANASHGGSFPSRSELERNFLEPEDGEVDDVDFEEEVYYDSAGRELNGVRQYGEEEDDPHVQHYGHEEPYSEAQDGLLGEDEELEEDPLYPGIYRALFAFEPEGTAEVRLVEDQLVRVVGRGGGVGWAVVEVGWRATKEFLSSLREEEEGGDEGIDGPSAMDMVAEDDGAEEGVDVSMGGGGVDVVQKDGTKVRHGLVPESYLGPVRLDGV